ncbi:hypothetical protein ES703_36561 [subsurface metagenome]
MCRIPLTVPSLAYGGKCYAQCFYCGRNLWLGGAKFHEHWSPITTLGERYFDELARWLSGDLNRNDTPYPGPIKKLIKKKVMLRYVGVELTFPLAKRLFQVVGKSNFKIAVSTKGFLLRHYDRLQHKPDCLTISMTGLNNKFEKLSQLRRNLTLEYLRYGGSATIRIQPIIPGVNDDPTFLRDHISQFRGAKHIMINFWTGYLKDLFLFPYYVRSVEGKILPGYLRVSSGGRGYNPMYMSRIISVTRSSAHGIGATWGIYYTSQFKSFNERACCCGADHF